MPSPNNDVYPSHQMTKQNRHVDAKQQITIARHRQRQRQSARRLAGALPSADLKRNPSGDAVNLIMKRSSRCRGGLITIPDGQNQHLLRDEIKLTQNQPGNVYT